MSSSLNAVHRAHVRLLYRRALKTSRDWIVMRNEWLNVAWQIRGEFRANMNETDPFKIKSLIKDTEEKLQRLKHPDPLLFPSSPGGTLYQRNLPIPPHLCKDEAQIYWPSEQDS